MIPKNRYHFSIDDVLDALIEVTDRKIPPQEHRFFKYLIKLHNDFNTNVDLYLFFQKNLNGKMRTLKNVSAEIFKPLFEKNPWLRVGPHALDYQTAPYNQTLDAQIKTFNLIYEELERLAGRNNFSKFLRLHYFSECFELEDYFEKKGVKALFTTDKDATAYRVSDEDKKILNSQGFIRFKKIQFIRSNFRSEDLANENFKKTDVEKKIDKLIDNFEFIVFFTHEYELVRKDVSDMTISIFEIIKNKGLDSL